MFRKVPDSNFTGLVYLGRATIETFLGLCSCIVRGGVTLPTWDNLLNG